MPINNQKPIVLLAAVAMLTAACSGSASDSSPDSTQASTSSADGSTASTDVGQLEQTFEGFGNPDASAVVVVAQGGPMPELVTGEVEEIFASVDLGQTYVVVPHQTQTLDPERFSTSEISFEEAKQADTDSTELLGNLVRHYVEQDREVVVAGISFGAFVVQDLLSTQGNMADGYFIQVGRLDMPAEVWGPFSEGRFVGFIDGVEVEDFDTEGAGMGGEGNFTDANMAKLAAGLGHKRYTELLADTDMANVVYAYGQVDEQVGRLSADELAFLESKNVTILRTEGDHGDTTDETIDPALQFLGVSLSGESTEASDQPGDDESGYLPAEDVAAYVEAYQVGLAQSSVTIDGSEFPVTHVGIESSITVDIDGGSIDLGLGDDGIESAFVNWEDREWLVGDQPEFVAIPEDLDGEGDLLHMILTAVDSNDPSSSVEVELRVDVNTIGMGSSVVEVVDGYATISGTLGTSTYVQLADLMENNPEVNTLVMMNVQGSENDEINVHTARLIREAGWTTWVPSTGDISSGGVDMFVAGVERVVEPGAFVGVHSWAGSDGEPTGRDYPRDHAAHRSQLEYFTEMMGEDAGTEFYFFTLEASPADQIHRMTPDEIAQYGLTTAPASGSLPEAIVGPEVGYMEIAEGICLKLMVESCSSVDGEVTAELFSYDLGPVMFTSVGTEGQLSFPGLEGLAPVKHDVSGVEVDDGTVAGTADLELAALVGDLDTSTASFELPCGGQ